MKISDFQILSGWIKKYKLALSKSDSSWDNSYCVSFVKVLILFFIPEGLQFCIVRLANLLLLHADIPLSKLSLVLHNYRLLFAYRLHGPSIGFVRVL